METLGDSTPFSYNLRIFIGHYVRVIRYYSAAPVQRSRPGHDDVPYRHGRRRRRLTRAR